MPHSLVKTGDDLEVGIDDLTRVEVGTSTNPLEQPGVHLHLLEGGELQVVDEESEFLNCFGSRGQVSVLQPVPAPHKLTPVNRLVELQFADSAKKSLIDNPSLNLSQKRVSLPKEVENSPTDAPVLRSGTGAEDNTGVLRSTRKGDAGSIIAVNGETDGLDVRDDCGNCRLLCDEPSSDVVAGCFLVQVGIVISDLVLSILTFGTLRIRGGRWRWVLSLIVGAIRCSTQ